MARTFLLGVLLALLLLFVGWLLVLHSLAGRPHVHNQWVEGAYAHKLAAAAAIDGPRALIVAGSGAMFGLDSAALGAALGRPVVNLGVNAGILAPYIIDHAEQALRPGDWLILPLEYPLYHDEGMLNQQFIDFYASHPLGAARIGWLRWLRLLWQLPLSRVQQGWAGMPPGWVNQGLYGAHNLDSRGDQRHSSRAERSAAMLAAVHDSAPEHYGARARAGWLQTSWTSGASWARWRQLTDQVHALGGCTVFLPPAMLHRPLYDLDPVEQAYYAGLPAQARAAGLNYLGQPRDFMYGEDDFFDTNFHLSAEARARHTAAVAALIAPALRNAPCTLPNPAAR